MKGEILKDIGEVPISSTQKIRVLIIKQEGGEIVVSAQKWWRASVNEDWVIGKGFTLDSEESNRLGELLVTGGSALMEPKL